MISFLSLTEALEPCHTSKMDCFSKMPFSQNAPPYMFDSVLNTPLFNAFLSSVPF